MPAGGQVLCTSVPGACEEASLPVRLTREAAAKAEWERVEVGPRDIVALAFEADGPLTVLETQV